MGTIRRTLRILKILMTLIILHRYALFIKFFSESTYILFWINGVSRGPNFALCYGLPFLINKGILELFSHPTRVVTLKAGQQEALEIRY